MNPKTVKFFRALLAVISALLMFQWGMSFVFLIMIRADDFRIFSSLALCVFFYFVLLLQISAIHRLENAGRPPAAVEPEPLEPPEIHCPPHKWEYDEGKKFMRCSVCRRRPNYVGRKDE